jgi:hypothetical protein
MTHPEDRRRYHQHDDREYRRRIGPAVITAMVGMVGHDRSPYCGRLFPAVKTTPTGSSRFGLEMPKRLPLVLNIFPNITFAHNW